MTDTPHRDRLFDPAVRLRVYCALPADPHRKQVERIFALDPRFTIEQLPCAGHRLLEQVEKSPPDLLLLDPHALDPPGDVIAYRLLVKGLRIPTIWITEDHHTQQTWIGSRLGVKGHLRYREIDSELWLAAGRLLTGDVWYAPGMLSNAVDALVDLSLKLESDPQAYHHLSERERGILSLIIFGRSNKEISRELHISAATVRVHISSILLKLHVHSRTAAALRGLWLGVASPEEAAPPTEKNR